MLWSRIARLVNNKGRRPIKITHAALLTLGETGKLLLADSFANCLPRYAFSFARKRFISGGSARQDVVGMCLNRIIYQEKDVHLNYDAESGGADFIAGIGSNNIAIEIGTNKKTSKQVIQTMKKIKSSYGVIISEKYDILEVSENHNIAKIPFKYFLLI